ncbi:hypothetical protein [Catellatospora sp. NPDC049609]
MRQLTATADRHGYAALLGWLTGHGRLVDRKYPVSGGHFMPALRAH